MGIIFATKSLMLPFYVLKLTKMQRIHPRTFHLWDHYFQVRFPMGSPEYFHLQRFHCKRYHFLDLKMFPNCHYCHHAQLNICKWSGCGTGSSSLISELERLDWFFFFGFSFRFNFSFLYGLFLDFPIRCCSSSTLDNFLANAFPRFIFSSSCTGGTCFSKFDFLKQVF